MRQRISSATGTVGFIVRACAALGLAGAAVGLATLPALATVGTWSQKLAVTIPAGSTLRAGYDVSMPQDGHPAATLNVAGGNVGASVTCPDGSHTWVVVSLPQQSYGIPAGNKAWFPSGDSASAATYQGTAAVPASFCGGRAGSANTVVFSADFTSTDGADKVNVRFHIADGSSGGAWSATDTVAPSSSSPTPAPSRTAAPAPPRPQAPLPSRSAPAVAPPSVAAAPTHAAAAAPNTPAPSPIILTAPVPTGTASPAPLTWWLTPASGNAIPGLQDAADARPSTLLASALALLVGGVAWVGRRRVTAAAWRGRRRRG